MDENECFFHGLETRLWIWALAKNCWPEEHVFATNRQNSSEDFAKLVLFIKITKISFIIKCYFDIKITIASFKRKMSA